MAERVFHEAPLADACYLAGGVAVFASAFFPWVARGAGSTLAGYELVDAVVALGRHVPAVSTGRLTILWYLVPALGAASWIAGGLAGAHGRAPRMIAGATLVVTAVVAVAFTQFVGLSRLGPGPAVALAGSIVLCAAAWWPTSPVAD